MRGRLLRLVRDLLVTSAVPGRYVLAGLAAKLLVPPGRVVDGSVGKYRVSFDFRDLLQRQAYFGLYDPAETALLSRVLKEGDTFFDIGANIGYYSLLASQIVGPSGQVHAFEPVAENVAALLHTIEANGICNIVPNALAVGARAGNLDLFMPDGHCGNSGWASVVPSGRRPRLVAVEQIAIDDYCRSRGIEPVRLVKLDIEGAEPEALEGMTRLLESDEAPDIVCEVNPYLLTRRGIDPCAIGQALAARGYKLFRVGASGLAPSDPRSGFSRVSNLFCTRRTPDWSRLRGSDGAEQ